jgi:phosphatidylglycerophosphatase C
LGARSLLRVALIGADPEAIRASLVAFGVRQALDGRRIQPQAVAALRAHLEAGDRVIVVTGCERHLVRAILDGIGFADVELVASELDFEQRHLPVRRHCFSAHKLVALAEAGVHGPWDIAYSDSIDDLPMLGRAAQAVCVNWAATDRLAVEGRTLRNVEFVEWPHRGAG